MTCRVHVSHQIHFPDLLPHVVRRIETATDTDAGIGAEQVDGPVSALGGIDECDDVGLATDIDTQRRAAQLCRDALRARFVEIRHRDMTRTLAGETTCERTADTFRTAGDGDDFA